MSAAADPKPPAPSTRDEVVARLRALIADAAPGTRVPTVRQLMAEYGVSQHLVQRAMTELRAKGMISSHVGRGTFVGRSAAVVQRQRNVLTLLYQHPYERGDRIARLIHQRLSRDGHGSLVLTYSDVAQVIELLRSGRRFDSCILQPRGSTMPVELLALLRQRSNALLIESQVAEHLDVDAVSNDPRRAVCLAVEHLRGLGHRRVAWLTEASGNYFFRRTAESFEAFRAGAGIAPADWPVIRAPIDAQRLGIADLGASLRAMIAAPGPDPITAVVVASFSEGRPILDAFAAIGRRIPQDVSVIKIGTPDLEADHLRRLSIVGRPSTQAAETVLRRLYWRWENAAAPFETIYDPPLLAPFGSTAPPHRGAVAAKRRKG
ncbi:MAG: LacI family DNA-binding transcriptional regulator [Alphaproteobacteria bacterium]|nr:LacI family DNA-binding transcriptional regulator [Alphaproteobacteria bacterium]